MVLDPVDKTRTILEDLARSLGDHPGAAASIPEDLEDAQPWSTPSRDRQKLVIVSIENPEQHR